MKPVEAKIVSHAKVKVATQVTTTKTITLDEDQATRIVLEVLGLLDTPNTVVSFNTTSYGDFEGITVTTKTDEWQEQTGVDLLDSVFVKQDSTHANWPFPEKPLGE
jgi:uncharacterized protein YciU (UPF0263 family)